MDLLESLTARAIPAKIVADKRKRDGQSDRRRVDHGFSTSLRWPNGRHLVGTPEVGVTDETYCACDDMPHPLKNTDEISNTRPDAMP